MANIREESQEARNDPKMPTFGWKTMSPGCHCSWYNRGKMC